MSVGSLHVSIALDNPDHIHDHGSSSPPPTIKGQVLLNWRRGKRMAKDAALFGPLQIIVVFQGVSSTSLLQRAGPPRKEFEEKAVVLRKKKPEGTRERYESRVSLFMRSWVVYEGVLRAVHGQVYAFGFEVTFPGRAEGGWEGSDWEEEGGGEFDAEMGQALPPSSVAVFRNGDGEQWEHGVEYRIGARVDMRGIDVVIKEVGEGDEPRVRYESARGVVDPDIRRFQGSEEMRSLALLPRGERRTRTMWRLTKRRVPEYAFDWTCEVATQLVIDQPVTMSVAIRPLDMENAAGLVVPDVTISGYSVQLIATTRIRAAKQQGSRRCPRAVNEACILSDTGRPEEQAPFGEANGWTRRVVTRKTVPGPSSFRTVNVARSYRLCVSFTIYLAGESRTATEEFDVTVHPPLPAGQGESERGGESRWLG